ncbi:MLO-like protein 9 [Dorcoceras hygrometricum]|uniref:MLO-like protein 9 n=1 Tax=Dorcoceras hygrometricum TaxID=472368 RepID=A0A2Z7CQQ6_9LAMI|nr:MLO-like protein 9 [Dorcoceras hygrometricum]
MVFFKETQTVTYESRASPPLFIEEFIKGLAAGDTSDAPYYHLGTREPNSSPQRTPTARESHGNQAIPEDRGEDLARPRSPSRYAHLKPPSPSINTRAPSDLGIGGATPDTLPAPSDQCFVVADINQGEALYTF